MWHKLLCLQFQCVALLYKYNAIVVLYSWSVVYDRTTAVFNLKIAGINIINWIESLLQINFFNLFFSHVTNKSVQPRVNSLVFKIFSSKKKKSINETEISCRIVLGCVTVLVFLFFSGSRLKTRMKNEGVKDAFDIPAGDRPEDEMLDTRDDSVNPHKH